jgi:magnesium transporter
MTFELTREFLDDLRESIEHKDEVGVFKMIQELHAADIAEIYKYLNGEESKFIYLLLDKEKSADVLIEMDEDTREKILEALPGDIIATQFIDSMDSDDAADVLAELSDEKIEEVLNHLRDVEQAGDIVDLLSYDEDTAGGLMAKELIRVNENWDIVTCIRQMRKQAEDIEELYYVYVVDDDNILKGTLSLKRMLLTKSSARIKNIQNSEVISVRTDTPREDVSQIMEKYDLVSLPVIDPIGRLVGRITIDDVVDVIREEAERDYQLISGITQDIESSDNVWSFIRARLPWLLIGLLGGILGAQVMSGYEYELGRFPQLAFFAPLIAAMGGNVGVQSSAIIVQGLANNTLGVESTFKKLVKEFSVAFINGLILASIILFYNFIFSNGMALTVTVSSALFAVIIFSSILGTLIPLLLERFKIDPALATGPFITTFNDIMGLLIYFMIGRMMFIGA